ncbi:MAG: helix-turn-helix domain-containing protein [Thermodesulfobacteriota bacterium]
MKIISSLVNKVKKAFKSKEYRHAYADEFLDVSIATQIKVLREQRNWGQEDLAQKVGMKQPRISVMENVNYSSWSINTLRKLAKAFDLTLRVSFESFGDRIKEIDRFNRKALERPSFDDDPAFAEKEEKAVIVPVMALAEANRNLKRSNELSMVNLERKEEKEEEVHLAVHQINPSRRQSHEAINRKASSVYLANLFNRPQSAWS